MGAILRRLFYSFCFDPRAVFKNKKKKHQLTPFAELLTNQYITGTLTVVFVCRHTVQDDLERPNAREGHVLQDRQVVLQGVPLTGGFAVLEEAALRKQHQPLPLAGDVEIPQVLFKFDQ